MPELFKAPESIIDTILLCSGWKPIYKGSKLSNYDSVTYEDYFILWNVPNTSLLSLTETYLGAPVSPTQILVIFVLTEANSVWLRKTGFKISPDYKCGDTITMYLRYVPSMPKLDDLLGIVTGSDEDSLLIVMAWQSELFPQIEPVLKGVAPLPWWLPTSKVSGIHVDHIENGDSIETIYAIKAALEDAGIAKYYDWSEYD